MDIKDIRRINLVGTVFFALFGGLNVASTLLGIYRTYIYGPIYDRSQELNFTIVILCVIIISTLLLYKYTVIGLDRGNYKAAKRFLLLGIIVGWIGWIIPSIAFLKSYLSFDEAISIKKKIESGNKSVH